MKMTKTQKIIVLAVAVLILIAVIYPPYIQSTWAQNGWSPQKQGWTWIGQLGYPQPNINVKIRFVVFGLEIFGILVLAGAAMLVCKIKRD